MIEPEVAFADLNDIMDLEEACIKYVIKYVLDNCPDELNFLNKFVDNGLIERLKSVAYEESFGRVTYTEAVEILEQHKDQFEFPVFWGCDLQTEHERYLTEQVFKKPVFVTNYPKEIKAFYMRRNDDGKTVAACDMLVPGIGELVGCSEREANYDKLVAAMEARGMDVSAYSQYLDLRKYGSVPHSGFGIGFDRLVMYVTGVSNIRDVLLYPRTPKELK
jgi:asparaginyl-tRNA synthetase